MMPERLILETPCEHGFVAGPASVCATSGHCLGGRRREVVVDYEAAARHFEGQYEMGLRWNIDTRAIVDAALELTESVDAGR